jgi:hypothetical protein
MSVGTLSNGYPTSDNFIVPLPKIQVLRGWRKAIDDASGIVDGNAFLLAT